MDHLLKLAVRFYELLLEISFHELMSFLSHSYSHRDAKEGRGIDKDDVRRYSEMCDNYYRTYYEEQYGNKGKRHGGGDGGGSSSDGGRRHDDGRRYDDSDEDRRSSSKRRHR